MSSLLGTQKEMRETPSLCSWSPGQLSGQMANEHVSRETNKTTTLQRIKSGERVKCAQEGWAASDRVVREGFSGEVTS